MSVIIRGGLTELTINMKSNHISREERLQNRILKLRQKINYGDYWTRKRFYPECQYCGVTIITRNMTTKGEDLGGHDPGCKVNGIEKEISYYQQLLKECSDTKKVGQCDSI